MLFSQVKKRSNPSGLLLLFQSCPGSRAARTGTCSNPLRAASSLPTLMSKWMTKITNVFQSLPGRFFSSNPLLKHIIETSWLACSNPLRAASSLPTSAVMDKRTMRAGKFQSLPGCFFSSNGSHSRANGVYTGRVPIPSGLLLLFQHGNLRFVLVRSCIRYNPVRAASSLPTRQLPNAFVQCCVTCYNPVRAASSLPTQAHRRELNHPTSYNPVRAASSLPTSLNVGANAIADVLQSRPGCFFSSNLVVLRGAIQVEHVTIPSGLLLLFQHSINAIIWEGFQVLQSRPGCFFSSNEERLLSEQQRLLALQSRPGCFFSSNLMFASRL